MRQRLTNMLQFNLNYTWSATRGNDDGDNPLGSVNDATGGTEDFFDLESNWGPASATQRMCLLAA